MNKNINIICKYASEYGGNFIPSILFLAKELRKNRKVIFTFPEETKSRFWIKKIQDEGFRVYFFKTNFKKEIISINKKEEIGYSYFHFISGLRAKLIYPFSRKMKLIIHVHSDFTGNKSISWKRKIKYFVEYNLLRRDAKYVFVSESLFNKKKKTFHSVSNCLCIDRIFESSVDIESFKIKNGISNNDTVFLLFGWSPYIKGVDIAIRAFEQIVNEGNKGYKLVIIHGRGNGRENCINYLKESLGDDKFLYNKNIIFEKPVEDVFSLFRLSDVLILSSRSEGFSYSVLEALYFNLRVLSSDIKACQWANGYDNFATFKSENYLELADLLKKNISFKKKEYFNKDILEKYSPEKWAESIIDIIG